ncbi:MAG: hypothetical protein AVDCRST_MAG49-4488 [uncultured Thermomicrobiales bacterium]|uniref:Uncharacterized protein n=1 Tax=uncultured Thermomicrobiales bacterium TaxID=1645740 RepID=A0A6J4VIG9_9BACT|nr:MAG: hypothetical protein AVDCRST_MAG49-4488 [uncultured Thermomicrobiales bacterium]
MISRIRSDCHVGDDALGAARVRGYLGAASTLLGHHDDAVRHPRRSVAAADAHGDDVAGAGLPHPPGRYAPV